MKRFIAIFSVMLVISSAIWARFAVPPRPVDYVSDFTNVLSPAFETRLNALLRAWDQETGNQLFVAVFKSLEGENLEDVSIRIAETWKPGRADKDNGVILTLFLEDRATRIEVGYGLESVLTDAISSGIVNIDMIPAFKAGDYEGGLESAVRTIIGVISGTMPQQRVVDYAQAGREVSNAGEAFFLLMLMVFIFYRFGFIAFLPLGTGYSSSGFRSSGGVFGGFSGGLGGGFGGGGASGRW